MRSLWTEPVEIVNQELEAAARKHRSPLRRIRALLGIYADFAQRNPDVYRGAFLLVRPESLPTPEAQPLGELPFYRLLRDAIVQGQEAGVVRPGDPHEVSQLLWSGLHGAISLPIHIDIYEVDPAERLVPAMIDALMRAIAPE